MSKTNRDSFLFLIGSCFFAILPLRGHLAFLAEVVVYVLLAWRVAGTAYPRIMPTGYIMQIVAILAVIAAMVVGASGGGITLDAIMTALCVALPLKLFETGKSRDFTIIYSFTLLLIGVDLCYQRDALTWALCSISFVLLVIAMVAYQRGGGSVARSVAVSSGVLVLITPIAIVFCLLMPTEEMSKWSMFASGGQAKTGMSDSMSPGDVSSLAMSQELAFKGKFLASPPDPSSIYWRTIVLDHFDGKRWSASSRGQSYFDSTRVQRGEGILEYELELEPSLGAWVPIYGDLVGISHRSSTQRILWNSETSELRRDYPLALSSKLDVKVDLVSGSELSGVADLRKYLQLPPGNSRTRKLALQLRNEHSSDDGLVRNVLHRIYSEGYSYTMSPQKLKHSNRIDEFLFNTREGFCEHYASAFVFILRSAGIPSRVVTGYHGVSSVDISTGSFEVRQSEAHAWAEYWTSEGGWVRVDPTASVHPDRVAPKPTKSIIASAFSNAMRFMGSAPGFFRLSAASLIENQENSNGKGDLQSSASENAHRGDDGGENLRDVLVIGITLSALIAVLVVVRRRRVHVARYPLDMAMIELSVLVGILGFKKSESETLLELTNRMIAGNIQGDHVMLREYISRCQMLLYGSAKIGVIEIDCVRSILGEIKKSLSIGQRILFEFKIAIGIFR